MGRARAGRGPARRPGYFAPLLERLDVVEDWAADAALGEWRRRAGVPAAPDPLEAFDDTGLRFTSLLGLAAPAGVVYLRDETFGGTLFHDLIRTAKESVRAELKDGTGHAYDAFAKCAACGQVYWRGAHHARLEQIVAEALRITAAAKARPTAHLS
ncbi:hypothetical protein GCM10022221_63680 [Actinocorallia aurea]